MKITDVWGKNQSQSVPIIVVNTNFLNMVVISAGASTRRTLLLAHLVSRKRDIKAVLHNDWGVTLCTNHKNQ
jgi:hypothetical protein